MRDAQPVLRVQHLEIGVQHRGDGGDFDHVAIEAAGVGEQPRGLRGVLVLAPEIDLVAGVQPELVEIVSGRGDGSAGGGRRRDGRAGGRVRDELRPGNLRCAARNCSSSARATAPSWKRGPARRPGRCGPRRRRCRSCFPAPDPRRSDSSLEPNLAVKSRAEPSDGAEAGLASRKRGGGGALTSGFCQSRSQPPSVASRAKAASESGGLRGRDEIGTAIFFAFSAMGARLMRLFRQTY